MKYVELLRERKSYGVCNGMIVFKQSSRVHSKISLNFPIRLPIGHTSGANGSIVAKPLLSAKSPGRLIRCPQH